MLIGILQTGESPADLRGEMGDYPAMFEKLLAPYGFTFRTWKVMEMDFPEDVKAADGWLITGSRFGAYEDHPFIKPLEDFIRKAYDAHVPMVGICFGHQIIAQALGGKVEKFAGGWSVGPTEYEFDNGKVVMNAWHQDQVTEKPAGAECIGRSDFCENAALVYDTRAFTVQAHPEFADDFVGGLIETRGKGVVPDALLAESQSKLGTPLDSPAVVKRIAEFFKHPRG
ncbi:type 1 glutamine amidotransferase [Acidimangrovimonas pyrenivorans]|uniref:Type 1 glutamine amidotransferase n=1 Tax=Acidimangrovimonas pyrenivorans TaxID=2030798 RepID=A0ABV7ABR0_9RHOB